MEWEMVQVRVTEVMCWPDLRDCEKREVKGDTLELSCQAKELNGWASDVPLFTAPHSKTASSIVIHV